MSSRSSEFWSGVRALLPLLLGVFPFGMIYGVLALESGLAAWQAQAMSALVFAGSSQIVLCQLLASHAPLAVIFVTIAIVNLRHVLYSASIAPETRHLTGGWKALIAYLLTDEAYAVMMARVHAAGASAHRHWFFFGAGLTLWSGWQLSTLAGLLVGGEIPPEWGFDFAVPLTFIALVVPAARSRADWLAVAVAGVAALLLAALPFKLSLIAATLLGVAGGVWMQRRQVR